MLTTTLAEQANRHHADAQAKAREAVHHAIEAGRLLTEAKAALPHGEWSKWLSDNFDGSARTAREYMKLSNRLDALPESKRQHAATLPSLRQALEAVTDDEAEQDQAVDDALPSLLSRPADHRLDTFTRWPDLLWAWVVLLDEAGHDVPAIADKLAVHPPWWPRC